MLITSLDNKKIKKYVGLKNVKNRYQEKLFLVEGIHLCEEANKRGLLVDLLLLENERVPFKPNFEITYVTESILKKLSNLVNFSKVIGVCRIKDNNVIKGNHLLILDNIQDPGNIGTIIRSSNAFNIDTIILSNDSVDIYNDKVIRSTQGMIFSMNIVYADIKEVLPKLHNDGYMILGTDVNSGDDVRNIKLIKYALIMGNEGHGLSDELKKMCDKNLYIKMKSTCESLNVAVATSIILYELNK